MVRGVEKGFGIFTKYTLNVVTKKYLGTERFVAGCVLIQWFFVKRKTFIHRHLRVKKVQLFYK